MLPDARQIEKAVALLEAGELVAFPTETVYGLGADAANEFAVARIFVVKGRPASHPLIVHFSSFAAARTWAAEVPRSAERLAEAFWPGPLTIVLPKAAVVPRAVTGKSRNVTVWKFDGRGIDCGPEASTWITRYLQSELSLVSFDASAPRTCSAEWTQGVHATTEFSDGYPVLVISRASLEDLNARLAAKGVKPLPMERFRPNLVVGGDLEPFEEDSWAGLRVGDVELRFGELCDRCHLTTIDLDTLVTTKEPTRTLARHRRADGKVFFGVRVIPVTTGRVAVGRYSTRGRLQLVLLRPMGEGLAMHGLYYADEVRGFADIEIDRTIALKEAELGLATQLIDQLSSESFDPKKYEDYYRADLLAAVDRKVAGEEIVVARPEEQREQIIDLVAALKKSLGDKAKAAPKAEAEEKSERKAPKAKGKKAASR